MFTVKHKLFYGNNNMGGRGEGRRRGEKKIYRQPHGGNAYALYLCHIFWYKASRLRFVNSFKSAGKLTKTFLKLSIFRTIIFKTIIFISRFSVVVSAQ